MSHQYKRINERIFDNMKELFKNIKTFLIMIPVGIYMIFMFIYFYFFIGKPKEISDARDYHNYLSDFDNI